MLKERLQLIYKKTKRVAFRSLNFLIRLRYGGDKGYKYSLPDISNLKTSTSIAKSSTKFGLIWADTTNIGDDIQTLAAARLLHKNSINEFILINRERLAKYCGPPVKLIMNGWFSHDPYSFCPPDNIEPLFISFHCANEIIIKLNQAYFKKFQPIACRDQHTVRLFSKYGIDAYFSGCLTLTFDEVTSTSQNIYLADVLKKPGYIQVDPAGYSKLSNAIIVPHELLTYMKLFKKGFTSSNKFYNWIYWTLTKNNPILKLRIAQELLNKYGEAELVITSRLHCALPCRAMNTDVIVNFKDYLNDPRFEGLHEYIQGKKKSVVDGKIDMSLRKADRKIINDRKKKLNDLFTQLISPYK